MASRHNWHPAGAQADQDCPACGVRRRLVARWDRGSALAWRYEWPDGRSEQTAFGARVPPCASTAQRKTRRTR